MKRLTAAIVLLMSGLSASGCRGAPNPGPPPITSPTSVVAAAPSAGVIGLPTLRVLIDDPRLVAARARDRAKDFIGAARALRIARPPALPPTEACGWDFLEGRELVQAGALAEGAAAFKRASADICLFSPWAHLRGSQALARSGRFDEAMDELRKIPDDVAAVREDRKILLAECLAAKGDRVGALALWREWLAVNPCGTRWVDTSVRMATALLDGVDGTPESHARESFELTSKVVVEAPKFADSTGATAARARATAVLRVSDPTFREALTEEARARQAQAWLDLGEPQRAFDAASPLVGAGKVSPEACRAGLVRANAVAKLRGNKVDAWPDAVAACNKDEQLVTVLYSGAKAKSGKDPKLAIEWFGRVETQFPTNRLADDARYRGALLVASSADEGHAGRADEMLRTLPDAYPTGDMRADALFRLALDKMRAGNWEGAVPLLDRVIAVAPNDHHWAVAGRAEYFRARAAAMGGDTKDAHDRFVAIVRKYPLAFYMLLAHARLAAEDPVAAAEVLRAAAARDADGVFPATAHPILQTPLFLRGLALLEVGEIEAAKKELTTAGIFGETADSETMWIVGSLYNRAGVPELGHAFSRGRLADHLTHYPEGRWRGPWEVAYPRAFDSIVTKSSTEAAIPASLTWAIMREESSFMAEVRSHANAIGLMQLVGPTAKWIAAGTTLPYDEVSLSRPEVSVDLGARLLAKLRATHGHPALAIGAYNGGSGAINRWMNTHFAAELDLFVELIPYEETRNYIKRVLSSQAAYAYLYESSALKEPLLLPLGLSR